MVWKPNELNGTILVAEKPQWFAFRFKLSGNNDSNNFDDQQSVHQLGLSLNWEGEFIDRTAFLFLNKVVWFFFQK